MIKRLLFFIVLFPFAAFAQYHITGKVVSPNKEPIASASVFLNNASAGAVTLADGTFDIANARAGHYDLIVSMVGFAIYQQSIVVESDMNLPDIEIYEQSKVLREVNISPDLNREHNFALFKKEFIGSSENAPACKILNPEVVDLKYNKTDDVLTASSADLMEIENKALGYKITYQLSKFTKSYNADSMLYFYYEGKAHFDDLKGNQAEMIKWQKNRLNTYLGSDMDFLRAIISKNVTEQGFTVRRLIRELNPDYKKGSMEKYKETLIRTPLLTTDYVKPTGKEDEYALSFNDCLYVTYKKPGGGKTTHSTIIFVEPAIYFDQNGVIINPQSAIIEGAWGEKRVADMLSVDYEPTVK